MAQFEPQAVSAAACASPSSPARGVRERERERESELSFVSSLHGTPAASTTTAAAAVRTRLLSWWVNTVHNMNRAKFQRSEIIWILGVSYGEGTTPIGNEEEKEEEGEGGEGNKRERREVEGRTEHERLPNVERRESDYDHTGFQPNCEIDEEDDREEVEEETQLEEDVAFRCQLRDDIQSRFWMTYRRDFPPLPGGGATSDVGWGCMLRSAQMMLAQALVLHTVGRDWRATKDVASEQFELRLLTLFADTPQHISPFSVHNILAFTSLHGALRCGDYHGPTSVSRALEHLVNSNGDHVQRVLGAKQRLVAYMAFDSLISRTALKQLFSHYGEEFLPVLLMAPVRLGLRSISDAYFERLEIMYKDRNFLGIIGGKGQHSLYFLGRQGAKLCGMDPHCCYRTMALKLYRGDTSALERYHSAQPRLIRYSEVEPSLALGFYCPTAKALESAIDLLTSKVLPGQSIVSVHDT